MRRLTLLFALICVTFAFIAAGYGYHILVRSPGVDIGIFDFILKAVEKILRFLVKP